MKKYEFGRSMIEMIGVLAIIGVISIGGVWGLNKAITKNTTNNIIEDVKLAGFIVVSELFDTLPDVDEETGLNLAGKFEQNSPYTFKAFPEGETTFEIFVPNVSYNVCMELKQRKVDWLEEIRANGRENVCKKDVMNEMSFFFNTELGNYPELTDNICRADRDCPAAKPYCGSNGYCQFCTQDEHCTNENLPYCRGGECVKCPELKSKDTNTCKVCPAVNGTVDWVSKDSCHDGCGNNYFYSSGGGVRNSERACSGCNYATVVQTPTLSECRRCPKRYFNSQTNDCKLCPSDKRVTSDGLNCIYVSCTNDDDCSDTNGLPYCRGGKCVKCPELLNSPTNPDAACKSCPAITAGSDWVNEDSCHDGCGENYFYASGRACYGCNAQNPPYNTTTLQECKRCSNRYFNETTKECLLCPNEMHGSSDGLSCVYTTCSSDSDCANTDGLPYCRGGKCVKCSGLQITYNKACLACPAINGSGGTSTVTERSCHEGCGENYFYTGGRACHGCDVQNPSYNTTTLQECMRCPRRYFDETTKECKLCPSGKKASDDGLSCVDG